MFIHHFRQYVYDYGGRHRLAHSFCPQLTLLSIRTNAWIRRIVAPVELCFLGISRLPLYSEKWLCSIMCCPLIVHADEFSEFAIPFGKKWKKLGIKK